MISVIIPAFNEEGIIEKSVLTLNGYMQSTFEDYEIIVSNDGSTDSTESILKALCKEHDRIKLSTYVGNRGKGSAVREGVLMSRGDTVIYTDCDLAYGTEVIKTVADRLENSGADIVIGSRNISADGYEGYPLLRRLASKIYIKAVCLISGFHYTDSQSGIKCFKGEAARKIFSYCTVNGYAFDAEMLLIADRMKLAVEEQAVKVINHRQKASKVHLLRDSLKMLREIRRMNKRIKKLNF